MHKQLDDALDILKKLVGFKSVSGQPTHDIVAYIRNYLAGHGIECTLSYDASGERSNVFASIGPTVDGGVLLNGHTDVVPVDGQHWQSDPFTLTRRADNLFGRGAVDMKGFLACVLASVPVFKQVKLKQPIHLAFTYDEEIGGFGMPVLLDSLSQMAIRPNVVIVGEPTEMKIITGHKGGYEMRTEITGFDVHSSDPRKGVNAISFASKLIGRIEEIGARHAANPVSSSNYEPPYTTFNVGKIEGGMARNATAGWCNFDWEFRPLPGDNGAAVITEIEDYADKLTETMKKTHKHTKINIITEVAVPALDDSNAAVAVEFIRDLTGLNSRDVVSFASDAGYFSNAGFSTVLFGPGSINRAHKPDEYIQISELAEGLDFLQKLALRLARSNTANANP